MIKISSYRVVFIVWMVVYHTCVCCATKEPLRLLVIDWISNFYSTNAPQSYEMHLPVPVNFLLAAKHINERRSDILEVLQLEQCNRNVSVTAFVDDGGNSAKAMYAITQYASTIDAIVGLGSSLTGLHIALEGTVHSKPIVSHWVTSPAFNNKVAYPFFARTSSSDEITAIRIVRLLNQWGYKSFSLLYQEVSWMCACVLFEMSY